MAATSHFGQRLRSERKRLGLSQAAVQKEAAISKTTQIKYEAGEGNPGIDYLQAIQRLGFDIPFVVTGQRGNNVNAEQRLLLTFWGQAPEILRAAAFAVLVSDREPNAAGCKSIRNNPSKET